MQKNEILNHIRDIDIFIGKECTSLLGNNKFELKLIGKSALLLAGLKDSLGTKDIDLLSVEGVEAPENKKIVEILKSGFNRASIHKNGFYIDFVSQNFALLPHGIQWIGISQNLNHSNAYFLEAKYILAGKLFSAHVATHRKQDRQDVRVALDQGFANFSDVCEIADQIFFQYQYDARSDHFPEVHAFLLELMQDYGEHSLRFNPAD